MKNFIIAFILTVLMLTSAVFADETYPTPEDEYGTVLYPLEGHEGYYVCRYDFFEAYGMAICDSSGKYVIRNLRSVEPGPVGTVYISRPSSMNDSYANVLNKDLKAIIPYDQIYFHAQVYPVGNTFYIEAYPSYSGKQKNQIGKSGEFCTYYDENGSEIEDIESFITERSQEQSEVFNDSTILLSEIFWNKKISLGRLDIEIDGVKFTDTAGGTQYIILPNPDNAAVTDNDTLGSELLAKQGINNYAVITVGTKSYYWDKSVNGCKLSSFSSDTGKLTLVYDDFVVIIGCEDGSVKVPVSVINGMDGVLYRDNNDFTYSLTDIDGTPIEGFERLRSVQTDTFRIYNLLKVCYAVGMQDSSIGYVNKDLKPVTPKDTFYGSGEIANINGEHYIIMKNAITGGEEYFDTDGNRLEALPKQYVNTMPSEWAKTTVDNAVKLNIVPEELQYEYTDKITRREYCRLAAKTYAVIKNTEIPTDETPFTDVDDPYVTFAYRHKIVAGVGNDMFAPDKYITRQEAAVMLVNLANMLEIPTDGIQTEKYADENEFAQWAYESIYKISAVKGSDGYIMAGVGEDKFSPLSNYTREQAIATLYRLYCCI